MSCFSPFCSASVQLGRGPLRRSWFPNAMGLLDIFLALLPIILYPGFISFSNESHLTHYIA